MSDEKANVSYLLAKLEEIHEDVKELRAHVDDLRQDYAGRKMATKVILVAVSMLGATVAWLVDHSVMVASQLGSITVKKESVQDENKQ
jgi:hypothetical protein